MEYLKPTGGSHPFGRQYYGLYSFRQNQWGEPVEVLVAVFTRCSDAEEYERNARLSTWSRYIDPVTGRSWHRRVHRKNTLLGDDNSCGATVRPLELPLNPKL